MRSTKPAAPARRTWGLTGRQIRCLIYAVLACATAAMPAVGLPTLLFLLLMDFVET